MACTVQSADSPPFCHIFSVFQSYIGLMEGIVLLHGIARTRRCMRSLEHALQDWGFITLNLDYPSTRMDLSGIAAFIHPAIREFENRCHRIHFIGYSMGGLVIRTYLKAYRLHHLGRVITLGTPHYGSEWADRLQNNWLYRLIFGPAGGQLVTNQSGFSHLFAENDFELGSIAGISSFTPLADRIIGQANDGKVSINSTRLNGMTDHVIISSWHFFLPSKKEVWRQCGLFLQNGRFDPATRTIEL